MKRLSLELGLTLLFAMLLWLLPGMLKATAGKASVSYLSLATNAVTLAILAVSWDLLARTGQLSLAHAAFYGAGAYTTAVVVKLTAWPMWLGIVGGGLLAVVLSLALGSVTLRLRGIYFAIATLAFGEVLRAAVQQLPSRIAGGAAGINVDALFRPAFIPGEMQRWELAFLRNERYFWVYAGLLVLTVFFSLLVQHTRLRHAFTAIRTNEQIAAVMGVRSARLKLLAFALSSLLVGLLGAVEAHRVGSVNPDETFAISTTVLALVTPIFGGLYSTLGPMLGAGVLSFIEESLRRSLDDGYLVGYGLVLVLSVLLMPKGLLGLLRLGATRLRRAVGRGGEAP